MSNVIDFPTQAFAENAIISMGELLDQLKNIPYSELNNVALTRRDTGQVMYGHEVLSEMSREMHKLSMASLMYLQEMLSRQLEDLNHEQR